MTPSSNVCPCGTTRDFDECCGPYLKGVRSASIPETLMRARYSAFVKHDLDFIRNSLHPSMRSKHNEESTRDWSKKSEWLGLEIRKVEGGQADQKVGTVEFVAHYRADGESVEHHEIAEFRREGAEWFFYDGKVIGGEPIRREADKVGRNDPCPCGSGKKFKKCCG
ncbi:MAG: YchJ family protein [Planctomycetota bacterium]